MRDVDTHFGNKVMRSLIPECKWHSRIKVDRRWTIKNDPPRHRMNGGSLRSRVCEKTREVLQYLKNASSKRTRVRENSCNGRLRHKTTWRARAVYRITAI